MAQCPVCENEYIEGQVSYCCTCAWNLMPYPLTFAGQLPEAFLENEQAKLAWVKKIWAKSESEPCNTNIERGNMNSGTFTTNGVWGTFEALLNKDNNSFQNPFEYDIWILAVEISHLSPQLTYNSMRVEGKYNLYSNIISSIGTSATCSYPHYVNSQIRAEASYNLISGRNFGQYIFWRKGEELRIESKIGNFVRVTGQLVRCEYRS